MFCDCILTVSFVPFLSDHLIAAVYIGDQLWQCHSSNTQYSPRGSATSLLKAAPKVVSSIAAMMKAVASRLEGENQRDFMLSRCFQWEGCKCVC